MTKATWKGATLAEAEAVERVEGNAYFAPEAVNHDHLEPSDTHTTCPWKGVASYYHVVVDGERNPDAAWYYPDPKPRAANIRGRIAFWRGVQVEG